VAWHRLASVAGKGRVGGKRNRIKTRLQQGASGNAGGLLADAVVGEVGVVEADVLVDVVVEAVVADAKAAANGQLAFARHVIGEADARTNATVVLVPDIGVALLEVCALGRAGERHVGEERIAIRRGSAKGAEVHVGVKTGFEVMRWAKIIPAHAKIQG